jgi:asparagine synthetase B (glutamine-hydrolysing)
VLFQTVLLNDTSNFKSIGLWLGILMIIISALMITLQNNSKNSKDDIEITKVVLNGDGPDELFAGYNNYMRNLNYHPYFKAFSKFL